MRPRIARLQRDRAPQQFLRLEVLAPRSTLFIRPSARTTSPQASTLSGCLPAGPESLLGVEMRLDRGHDLLGDVVLHREDVVQLAVVLLGPDVLAAPGVDQLAGDAQPPAGRAHAALQHVAHAEVARDLAHVDRAALVGEGRVAGDHEQPAQPGERGDDVLGDAVGEIVLLGIAAEIGERQHRDRRLVGQGEHRCRRLGAGPPAPGPHRPGDVLDRMLAGVLEVRAERADLLVHRLREADPAGLGQPLEAGDDVDALAQDVVAVDHDVAEIDADAIAHAPVLVLAGLARGQRPLHLERTAHRIHHARKFDQQPVAHGLDDPPAERGDRRIDHLAAQRPLARDGAFLVEPDEPRIPDHVGHENSRETPTDPLRHVPLCS